jgi:hypothetical protein
MWNDHCHRVSTNLQLINIIIIVTTLLSLDGFFIKFDSSYFFCSLGTVSDNRWWEYSNTNFTFNIFFPENCAMYVLVCKNTLQLKGLQMTTWYATSSACQTTKATNKHYTNAPQCYIIQRVRKVAVHLGHSAYFWLSVSKLPLQCAVVSLYSVVK